MIQRNQRLLNRLNALSDAGLVLLGYLLATWLWLDVISRDQVNLAHIRGLRSGTLLAALVYEAWTVLLLWSFHIYRTSRTHQARLQTGRILAGNAIALLTAAAGL